MTPSDAPPMDLRLPLPLRAINTLGALLGGRWPALDAAALWSGACRAAEVDEDVLPEARQALGVLVDEAARAPLSTIGRIALRTELQLGLEQLMRVRAAVPGDPPPVLPPVVIASLPRTGTTLLHRLMSLHRDARWPRMWELQRPWPAPASLEDDPRIALTERTVRDAHRVMPALDAIHALDARGPDECYWLLAQTACCASFDAQLPVGAYTDWVLRQDPTFVYRHHHRALSLLQTHLGGAFWLLKTPLHLFGLSTLRAVYPDARLVVTHRAPREVAGSCCSLYESARAVYVPKVDPATLGAPWLDVWGRATDAAAEALADWPADRVAHVAYADLVRAPEVTVDALVARLDLPPDPGLADRITRHLRDAAPARPHRYALERYGLRAGAVDERFAAWRALAPEA